MSAKKEALPGEKSVIRAYFLWLFSGIFGGHHFYLRRDRHAFVWWTTLGGFGVGWLGEIFRIPRYVRDANQDPQYMQELANRMLRNKKPPFSMNRFTGMLMVGYSWGQMAMSAVPPDEFNGINLRYLNYLVPLVAALGVWTVGNIGREQGSLKWPLLAAYAAYPVRFYVYDETVWFTLMVLASALAFDSFSKEWRKKTTKNSLVKRIAVLGLCASLYVLLWVSYLYFHGTITDSEGDEVPIYEALHHFFTSPWWLDVKQCLIDTYQYAQHHGWYEVWKQIIELSDPHGEQNAYKVLGLGPDASQQEITSTWRRLSRENHPDKVKDELQRRVAQERFMEIQQAYEILSNSKHRRNRRNKKDNSEPRANDKVEL
ncbi:dnaJ homolog subfamily C member 22 [Pectinophora gossypiella]|uniref:dnaJ homolog subfamily C member 22 n=1 Tax=Pectinophora gossypiella TaxID=13191 RepID=UPI00214E72F1|nr:dnaJ homolog subfamily C member 22 [Pectinophora gossypiella]